MFSWRKPKPPELDNELQFHIDGLVAEKMAAGLTPNRRGARRCWNSEGRNKSKRSCATCIAFRWWTLR